MVSVEDSVDAWSSQRVPRDRILVLVGVAREGNNQHLRSTCLYIIPGTRWLSVRAPVSGATPGNGLCKKSMSILGISQDFLRRLGCHGVCRCNGVHRPEKDGREIMMGPDRASRLQKHQMVRTSLGDPLYTLDLGWGISMIEDTWAL